MLCFNGESIYSHAPSRGFGYTQQLPLGWKTATGRAGNCGAIAVSGGGREPENVVDGARTKSARYDSADSQAVGDGLYGTVSQCI